jgi:hypothetical protein
MKTITHTIVLATALLAAASVSASAQSIGGSYTVAGTNLDGTTYEGTAAIALTSETTCAIKWVTGSTESEGICMRNGDSFAAGYVSGDTTGLVIYKVLPDGTLNGLWTIANNGGAGTEILTPAH